MKLATYKDGSRDGQLLVVSRDLGSAHYAAGIATRLQQLLDDWNFIAPQLQDLYERLSAGKARHAFAFEPARCTAPLPRAYQWVAGPSMQPCPGDDLRGPADADGVGAALGGAVQIAVVTGDLGHECAPEAALEGVRLLALAHVAGTPAQRNSASAFAPLALTPDEAGAAWREGRLHAELRIGGVRVHEDIAPAMPADFGRLIADLCATRRLRAGSIVGACVAEVEPAARIEALDGAGASLFGAIEPGVGARTLA
ncbi:MAG TPA: fumarylacetoacetate hydrolase [Burkholderiaceae bacterium]